MKKAGFLSLKILVVSFLIPIFGCSENDLVGQGDQKDFNASILTDNKLMQYFVENHFDQKILKYAEADLDNDGKDDLIVIYQINRGQNQMSLICHQGTELAESNSVPAPVSDQMIQFRDIDEKPPLEFILQGRKGAKVGYAIFRFENGKLVDLFGEGMEDCC